jgi:hypothetical protein
MRLMAKCLTTAMFFAPWPFSEAREIVLEDDVEHPMEPVLYAPVAAAAASMAFRTPARLWEPSGARETPLAGGELSVITISPGDKVGTRTCSI